MQKPTALRSRIPLILLAWLLFPLSAESENKTDFNLSPNYAQTIWPAGHRDSGNTDYVPVVMSRSNRIKKHLLKGHPIFWAPIAGPDGSFYITSGKGPGHSHLHAIDSNGNMLWEAPPQQSLEDLDSFALINAPIVARNGDVYVGDQNQLWAFHADGKLKWVSELTPYDVEYGFMTAIISQQGFVGGITTNGKVIFFRAEDGKLALPVLDLPGGNGPPAQDTAPEDLWKDLMDPAIKGFMFNLIQGWEIEVANTPAVHPETGRIFITAAGREPGTGTLYGIDVFDDRLEIAFEAPMGGGSGTSPAISHDGKQVYALDEDGHMLAIDADTGKRLWQTAEGGGGAASPSVGPDGTIYTVFHANLIAFNPDGTLKFQRSYDDLAASLIPEVSWLWGFVFSQPVAFISSLFTVGEKEGWINLVSGYHIKLLPSKNERTLVPIPIHSSVVAVDLETGDPVTDPLPIPETSEGFITPMPDGNTFVTLSGAISSIFYHSLNSILPKRFEVPAEPEAGLLILEPTSRRALAREGLDWLDTLIRRAAEANARGEFQEARRTIRRGTLQFEASRSVLRRAEAEGAIGRADLQSQFDGLARVRAGLDAAATHLRQENVNTRDVDKLLAEAYGELNRLSNGLR